MTPTIHSENPLKPIFYVCNCVQNDLPEFASQKSIKLTIIECDVLTSLLLIYICPVKDQGASCALVIDNSTTQLYIFHKFS
jgi:hypothetical protein